MCPNFSRTLTTLVSNTHCNPISFAKLPWPGESEWTLWSSSWAATVYHARERFHTVPLIAERQAGKLCIPILQTLIIVSAIVTHRTHWFIGGLQPSFKLRISHLEEWIRNNFSTAKLCILSLMSTLMVQNLSITLIGMFISWKLFVWHLPRRIVRRKNLKKWTFWSKHLTRAVMPASMFSHRIWCFWLEFDVWCFW